MISQSAASALKAVVGDDWFLNQPEDIATYAYDGFLPEFDPDAILVPETARQISDIMKNRKSRIDSYHSPGRRHQHLRQFGGPRRWRYHCIS